MQIDSVFLDYGGVVADHYCEPFLGYLARELGTSRDHARELLSERSEHGRLFRLDRMSPGDFWNAVRRLAPRKDFSDEVMGELWARTYIPNEAVLSLLDHLRTDQRMQTGVVMNEDRVRLAFIEERYSLARRVSIVLASCDVGSVKPERAMYIALLDRARRSFRPASVLYIDDRESHVAAAEAVGMRGYVYKNAGELSVYFGRLLEASVLVSFDESTNT